MTKVTYKIDGRHYEITAEGHADFKAGEDIVCSAISSLLQTLWAGMVTKCNAEGEQRQESGYFRFSCDVDEDRAESADTLFLSIVYGLELIANVYPYNLEVHGGRTEK